MVEGRSTADNKAPAGQADSAPAGGAGVPARREDTLSVGADARSASDPGAEPRRGTSVRRAARTGPPPPTGMLPVKLLESVDPALTVQDLSEDRLLTVAARVQIDNKAVPVLGGIPLFVKLGQGGLGRVYYGLRPRSKTPVAVKVVALSDAQKEVVERFESRAQAEAKVQSPHLVPALFMGEDNGLLYVVTEYIAGTSAAIYLHDTLASTKAPLPEHVALDLVLAATKGLVDAHKNGIIHGDIKPENILIPKPKHSGKLEFQAALLADLGLPRVEMLGGVLACEDAVIGTPGYMAPEQAADEKAARKASDVFSLGVTLYTLLVGKPPFPMDNPMTAIMHTIQTPHEAVTNIRMHITAATSQLVDTCLAKQPSGRYVDASALLEALTVCRAALGTPQSAQVSVMKRITLVLRKAEVGNKVAGAEGATPTALPFLAELAAAATDGGYHAARPLPASDAAPDSPHAGKRGQSAAVKGHPPRAVGPIEEPEPEPARPPAEPQPAGSGQAPRTYARGSAPPAGAAGIGAVRIVAAVAAAVLVLAGLALAVRCGTTGKPLEAVAVVAAIGVFVTGGLVYVWRATSPSIILEALATHAVLLKSAREMLKADPSAATMLLQQARKLGINDPQWLAREQAVETLIAAQKLMQSDGNEAVVEKCLNEAAAVYPGDPTIEWMREKIRNKPAGSSAASSLPSVPASMRDDHGNPRDKDDLRAILQRQLHTPLQAELAEAAAMTDHNSEIGSAQPTFADLLLQHNPPMKLLSAVKQFAKLHRKDPKSPLPADVATAIYFACLAAAVLSTQGEISELDDKATLEGFKWCQEQPWMDERIGALVREAIVALTRDDHGEKALEPSGTP